MAHGEEYKWIHAHYTTRAGNPPEEAVAGRDCVQALTGDLYDAEDREKYDPEKLLKDIRYPESVQSGQHKQPERESPGSC